MLIVWRGLGFLVPLVVLLSLLISAKFPANPTLAGGIALFVSAALIWAIGTRLNRQVKVHTLFWIPMQYWGIVMGIFAPLVIFGKH